MYSKAVVWFSRRRVLILLFTALFSVLWYPPDTPRPTLEGLSVEPHLGAALETDVTGDFAWILSPSVWFVLANNDSTTKSARLRLTLGLAPCSKTGEVLVKIGDGNQFRINLSHTQTVTERGVTLTSFERRIVTVTFANASCQLSATDERKSFGLMRPLQVVEQ